MPRKIIQTGTSLAVTLPKDIVDQLRLKKGDEVEVTAHPVTGTITVRPPVRYAEDGEVTTRFQKRTAELLKRRAALYRELAK